MPGAAGDAGVHLSGNHDWYSPKCPYARLKLPENVHIFTKPEIESVELPELGLRVYGAAFTDKHSGPMLRNFRAERQEGVLNILCIHGELGWRIHLITP